ncbi:MAG: T9SS type A sorting domain-containing protein [Vicingus serpentipes]|nr:T9SS type A sorting domain-containing protein [Vicingus serpentipes]
MKKKVVLFTFYFLLFAFCSVSQNLVPNWSFENFFVCPNGGGQITKAVPWFQPEQNMSTTTDYFNQCATSIVGVPANQRGYQEAKTGVAYGGIILFMSLTFNAREYMEIKLTDSLKPNYRYLVSFYVNLGEVSGFAIDAIGAHFSVDSVLTNDYYVLPHSPQIINKNGIINDTLNWIKIQDTLVANGGEQFMTIGNFNNDSTTSKVNVTGGSSTWAYYYVDDVSVILIDSIVGITENNNKHGIKVYPNPSMGQFFVEHELKKSEKGGLELYDLIGKKVFSQPLNPGLKREHINLNNQENGIYLYKVIVNEQVVHTEKLLMIKQ